MYIQSNVRVQCTLSTSQTLTCPILLPAMVGLWLLSCMFCLDWLHDVEFRENLVMSFVWLYGLQQRYDAICCLSFPTSLEIFMEP